MSSLWFHHHLSELTGTFELSRPQRTCDRQNRCKGYHRGVLVLRLSCFLHKKLLSDNLPEQVKHIIHSREQEHTSIVNKACFINAATFELIQHSNSISAAPLFLLKEHKVLQRNINTRISTYIETNSEQPSILNKLINFNSVYTLVKIKIV